MKRVVLLILLIMLVAWFAAVRHEITPARHRRDRPRVEAARAATWISDETRRTVREAHREAHDAIRQAHHEARQAIEEARQEVRAALAEASEAGEDVREALWDADQELRETVEGIPVPIVQGTRVDRAVPQPPGMPDLPAHPLAEAPAPPAPPTPPALAGKIKKNRPSKPPVPPTPPTARHEPRETRVVDGLVSATEATAREEARKALDELVAGWIEPEGVPRSWQPPRRLVDAMIVGGGIEPVVKDYGTVYLARLTVDVSPERRSELVHAYQRQVVNRRMVMLGGGLAFLLTCLGALSGYIRADEATKGYYTNRLRLAAAAGVGAAGVVLYRMIV